MTNRVFISSVMRDFAAERAAAKEAVITLRQQPVMAEDFGAQPISSQLACLEGVRSSDICVGIYGERYGYVAPTSKLAATEEEFHEARRRGMPILCFEKIGPKELAQEEFLRRIKAYETGYAFAFFDSSDKLKIQVIQALHDLTANSGITRLEPATASTALNQHSWGSRRAEQFGTWLGAVIVPARQGETFLDILSFGRQATRDALIQPALFGESALFKLEHGVRPTEETNALVIHQEAGRQGATMLAIHTDGSLVFGTSLSQDRGNSWSLGQDFIIDEEEVEGRLGSFLAYAAKHYKGLERGDLITSLFLGASLTGIDNKKFGKLPPHPLNAFSMPRHGLSSPLKVPEPPLYVSRADLSDPAGTAHKMTEHMARIFRNANAYYSSKDQY